MSIADNIKAREQVKELISFIEGGGIGNEQPLSHRFWELLGKACQQRDGSVPAPPEPEPMTDDEASEFETLSSMPYGAYAAVAISHVPYRYLLAISDPKTDPFHRDLKRYLKSDYFQRKQDDSSYTR